MPEGYQVVNGTCRQVFVANETKDVLFYVQKTQSPEPDTTVTLTTRHRGRQKRVTLAIKGQRTERLRRQMEGRANRR